MNSKIIKLCKSDKQYNWDTKFYKNGVEELVPKTGYYSSYDGNDVVEDPVHYVYKGSLKPNGFSRGQSSVTQNLVDIHDNNFIMAASATSEFLDNIANGNITLEENGYFNVVFILKKQGSTVSLFPYYDDSGKND